MTVIARQIPTIQQVSANVVSRRFLPYLFKYFRYEVYYGGRGSGKSTFVARKLILRARMKRYFKCVYVRKTSKSIRESSFSLLCTQIKKLGFAHEFRIYTSTMKIVHIPTGNTFIAYGLDDPEKVKSLDDPNYLWCEEPTELEEDDFTTLDKTIRSPQAECCAILSFNPVHESNWTRKYFFDEEDYHKPNARFADKLLVHRTTYKDNDFLDHESYYRTLFLAANGRTNRIRVDIEGDWGMPENLDPWLYAFDREVHVLPKIPFNPTFGVYLSFDFNIDPVTCVAVQFSPNLGMPGSFVYFIKEFGGKKKLSELCAEIKAYFPQAMLFVTGDCNGNKGDITMVNEFDTYYTLIKGYLRISAKQLNVNTSNLRHSDSRLLMNTLHNNYFIRYSAEGCPTLIADCEKAQVCPKGKKAGKPNQLNKDRGKGFHMDYFDGSRYFFQRYFKEFADSNYFTDLPPKEE